VPHQRTDKSKAGSAPLLCTQGRPGPANSVTTGACDSTDLKLFTGPALTANSQSGQFGEAEQRQIHQQQLASRAAAALAPAVIDRTRPCSLN